MPLRAGTPPAWLGFPPPAGGRERPSRAGLWAAGQAPRPPAGKERPRRCRPGVAARLCEGRREERAGLCATCGRGSGAGAGKVCGWLRGRPEEGDGGGREEAGGSRPPSKRRRGASEGWRGSRSRSGCLCPSPCRRLRSAEALREDSRGSRRAPLPPATVEPAAWGTAGRARPSCSSSWDCLVSLCGRGEPAEGGAMGREGCGGVEGEAP